jgi:hypothetical protein
MSAGQIAPETLWSRCCGVQAQVAAACGMSMGKDERRKTRPARNVPDRSEVLNARKSGA